MLYYLSGPMRGLMDDNYPLFEKTTRELRAQGYRICSPHELNSPGRPRRECMTNDLTALMTCDAVVCLPGWEFSPGACVEVAVAWCLDMPVYELTYSDPPMWLIEETSLVIPRELQYSNRIPLVGLCGFAQSGKDTVAARLVERGFVRVAFADALRDMLYALDPIVDVEQLDIYENGREEPITTTIRSRVDDVIDGIGWDDAKTSVPEVRELLQRLGTEAGREVLGNDTWVRVGEDKIERAYPRPVVVTDCRFPNELQMVRRRRGTLIWVDRPGVEAVNKHVSEHSVNFDDCDIFLENHGTLADLYESVDVLAETCDWVVKDGVAA